MARITVGITSREGGDSHWARRNEGPAITDPVSRGHVANQHDPRLPRHDWPEQPLEFRERRNPVEHDPAADDFVGRVVECERARTLENMRLVVARDFGAKSLH